MFDDAALDQISDTITNETAAALGRKGNASGWYNEDIKKTIKTINKIHPEIKKGNVNEGMFMLGMAITSNGKTVDYNFKAAEHLYQHFKRQGGSLMTRRASRQQSAGLARKWAPWSEV